MHNFNIIDFYDFLKFKIRKIIKNINFQNFWAKHISFERAWKALLGRLFSFEHHFYKKKVMTFWKKLLPIFQVQKIFNVGSFSLNFSKRKRIKFCTEWNLKNSKNAWLFFVTWQNVTEMLQIGGSRVRLPPPPNILSHQGNWFLQVIICDVDNSFLEHHSKSHAPSQLGARLRKMNQKPFYNTPLRINHCDRTLSHRSFPVS